MAENFAARLEAVARAPGRPALLTAGASLAWPELDARASGVADDLEAGGVRAGDRIALALPNGLGFVAALLGAWKLGATVCPLNPQLTPGELEVIERDLEPRAVVRAVSERLGDRRARARVEAPALILYTSGSTGRPKGAILSHAAVAIANRSWAGPVMGLTDDDVVLGVLPFAHSFGINGALLAPLLAGAGVVVLERFDPEAVLDAIAGYGVTVFPAVATMFRRVLDAPACSRGALASLRLAVSGAAPCPWDLACAWRARTGVRILRGYGMTELFRPISYLAGDAGDTPGAIGRAVPGVELRVVDDAGRPLGPGETGELWIASPCAMDGYLEAPAETRAVLSDGWFRTGDLATIDPDGLVSIVGRKKELILRGGYSVSPAEVEAALLAHPEVTEAAVVGVPHAELGEEVVAFVVLAPGALASADALADHCRARLAAYKCPRRVRVLPALPRSATGKILKGRLAEGPSGGAASGPHAHHSRGPSSA